VVLAEQDRAAVALAQRASLDQLQGLLGELEQPYEVRDRHAAASHPPTELLLRQPEIVHEHRAGARLLDGVEIDARHVLGERQVEALPVVGVAHERGDRLELYHLGRAQPPLTRHELEAPAGEGAHHDRLEHPACPDRLGKLGEPRLVERAARLTRVRLD
jgi:hypothetical protein